MIVRVAVVSVAVVALVTLMLPRTYTVEVSIVPVTPAAAGGRVAGLAAQFGLGALGMAAGQSPDFYASYLQSREIHRQVLAEPTDYKAPARWWSGSASPSYAGTVLGGLGVNEPDSSRASEQGIERLAGLISVKVDRLAGTVLLKASTHSAEFSKDIAEAYLRLLMEFNNIQRQTQASAERSFVGDRLVTATAELRGAEVQFRAFLERNRTWHTSPALVIEHDRLRREVDLKQSIVSTLSQSYEQARIDEVRDTPALLVVQSPHLPGVPDRRGLLLKLLGAAAAGFFGAMVFVVAADVWRRAVGRAEPPKDLATLAADASRDLRAPWRLLW